MTNQFSLSSWVRLALFSQPVVFPESECSISEDGCVNNHALD